MTSKKWKWKTTSIFHHNESETARLKDSVKSKNSFINEASGIPNTIIIGEHGEADETINAIKSHGRTNQITDLKHENSLEEISLGQKKELWFRLYKFLWECYCLW